jgi:hypothetical protein
MCCWFVHTGNERKGTDIRTWIILKCKLLRHTHTSLNRQFSSLLFFLSSLAPSSPVNHTHTPLASYWNARSKSESIEKGNWSFKVVEEEKNHQNEAIKWGEIIFIDDIANMTFMVLLLCVFLYLCLSYSKKQHNVSG